jgi:hypothetical protein
MNQRGARHLLRLYGRMAGAHSFQFVGLAVIQHGAVGPDIGIGIHQHPRRFRPDRRRQQIDGVGQHAVDFVLHGFVVVIQPFGGVGIVQIAHADQLSRFISKWPLKS